MDRPIVSWNHVKRAENLKMGFMWFLSITFWERARKRGCTVYWNPTIFKNPTIYNIIRWFAGLLGQMTQRPGVWCSNYYSFFHNFLQKSFLLIFYSCFECPKSIRNHKKIMLGTSDAWSTSHLSQWTSNPVYYIEDCRIVKLWNCPPMI